MWVVHAGNQVDSPDRPEQRFPAENVEWLEARVRRFLAELRPNGVVSAAAAGADLIVLDVAQSLGLHIEVVLPLEIDDFFERSVRPHGDAWTSRFNRVLADHSRAFVHDLSAHDDWYLRGNEIILDRAVSCADREGVLAVAVRPPEDPNNLSATDDFVRRATRKGLTAIDLDPRKSELPTAFVVMPFGMKDDPSRGGVTIDCDATFHKVIVPILEDADLDWTRADRSVESGFIHVGMFDQIAHADVVIADLTVENPNVLYELGVRHALRPRATVMIHREGGVSMFDLRPLREFRYPLAGAAITDDEAFVAMETITPGVLAARNDSTCVDSPFHTLFDVSPTPQFRLRSGSDDRRQFLGLEERLTNLERSARAKRLNEQLPAGSVPGLIEEIRRLDVDSQAERSLLFRLAVVLRGSGRYDEALTVHHRLTPDPVRTPVDVSGVESLKERALCHRRLGEQMLGAGRSPDDEWRIAAELLDLAMSVPWRTADTLGVAGGLAKRRGERALRQDDRPMAVAQFDEAARCYDDGAEIDPTDYYLLLNAVTTARVAGFLAGRESSTERATLLLPIARYFAQRAYDMNTNDAYAAATLGELAYTEYQLAPAAAEAAAAFDHVALWYGRARAAGINSDSQRAMADQLGIYEILDGSNERLARIRSAILES